MRRSTRVVMPMSTLLLLSLAFSISAADSAVAPAPQAVNPETIKDKVSITLREEFAIEFRRDGDQLLQPTKCKETNTKQGTVKIKLGVTADSPVPPPREGATRPYLTVNNNLEKSLHFRALVRLKGSKEFIPMNEDMKPVPAGDFFQKCWEFDSLVEEVVLCEFKLSEKPIK